MPLWGATTSDESKPKNLTAEEKSRVFADTRGWVITRPDGKEEVLVAIRNLSGGATADKLGEATISQVFFLSNEYQADGLGIVRVVWNEKVNNTTTGQIVVTRSDAGTVTASRLGGTGTNYVDYQFRVPNVTSITLTIAAQTLTGTYTDAGSGNAADKVIAATDVDSAAVDGGATSSATVANTPAVLSTVFFGANSYSTGTTGTVVISWSEDVTATTTGTMSVTRSDTSTAITATQHGPAAGTSVTFRFLVPSTTGVTLSITSQTISMGLINADTLATTADLTIALVDVIGAAGDGGSTSVVTTA